MPAGYIARALQRVPTCCIGQARALPHPWQRPNYGAKQQMTATPIVAPSLTPPADKLRMLEVLGTLLYYFARAVDSILLTGIGELATEQASGTKSTIDKLTQ